MTTLVNGSEKTQVSVNDRGLMYGQCVFETIVVNKGKPCLLDLHLERLAKGAKCLGIDFDRSVISAEVIDLAQPLTIGIIRVNLTMGEGGRGYQNPVSPTSTRIISQHDYPSYPKAYWHKGIVLGIADIRLSHQPLLAGIKHGNRLEQVIARSQWQDSWQEALLLDVGGNVIEATQSNVFLVKDDSLITPSLEKSGVEGVMRQTVIDVAKQAGIDTSIQAVTLNDIKGADEVFLSNSVIGIWPVKLFEKIEYSSLTLSNKLLKIIEKNEFIPTV